MSQVDPSVYLNTVAPIHNRLFFRLFQASNTLDRQCQKEIGISSIHWSVLGALSRPSVQSGMTFSELTSYLGVSRQSLDGVLKRLERDGEVVRVSDTQDRRVKNVALTEKGQQAWVKLQTKISQFYQQTFEGFSFDDMVTFVHLINKLNESMAQVHIDQDAV
ncbi:MarR family transcriptional regulator [Acinetobacter sp. 187]|uniref:MarR family winged helix-turn-helix transcriptional regulator n=1 Tax=Acinetobacter lanii TaxID=2715163 RepID=UPI00140D913C|nr:MarR family transcriptional regulator [Acinetobacter lanii]NHC02692.1 MarR family transcriptional regulator [Acinetobacter lanii]